MSKCCHENEHLNNSHSDLSRREFLASIAAFGAGIATLPAGAQIATTATGTSSTLAETTASSSDTIPRRPLGRTGVTVSAIGLGGSHMAGGGEALVARMIHQAMESGLDFLDNAWEYGNGFAEEAMGKALVGRRDKAFLMTKVCTHGRGKKVALQQLDESLRRLRTDYLDLWQIHEVVHDNEPNLHFHKGGVIEAMEEARKAGKVRFLGFTGHKDPGVHMKMLRYNYPFDTSQMPLNCFDASYKSFENVVLPELQRQNIAPLGMKCMGGNARAIRDGVITADEALRYAMSLPVATTISGMDSIETLEANLRVARGFKPMSPAQMDALRHRLAPIAASLKYEEFKRPLQWDGGISRQTQELIKQGKFEFDS